jgi:hypothetical protein
MSGLAPIDWRRIARRLAGPAVILAAAALAGAPQRIHGISCGHDFDFHLLSWFETLDSWRRGLIYPHWAISPNYGAGEPRFVFYPPLTWMLGAALRLIMAWEYVPVVLVFLLLAGTGFATRALARQILEDGAATLAGCTAIFSGYALFTAYERSAYGELTGGFWIPLLLLFALRDPPRDSRRDPPRDSGKAEGFFRRALDGSVLPLTLVVAGAWLSNVPLGVMASYMLAAVALGAALLRRSWAPVVRATTGAALGIGLASFFLVSAAWEQRWADVAQATSDPGSRIENSWLFARHANPALQLHDSVLLVASIIATTMLGVALAGLVVCRLRGRLKTGRPGRGWWILLACIPAAVLVLLLPISLPVWNLLPKLRLLQFPWRWLVVLEAPMGILFAGAMWPAKRWRQVGAGILLAGLFVGATLFADRVFRQSCDADDSIPGMLAVYGAGDGFDGTDEYGPPGGDDSLVPTGLPGACLVSEPTAKLAAPATAGEGNPDWDADEHRCEATFAATWPRATWLDAEHFHVAGQTGRAGYLVLRLRNYPAWRATVNVQPAAVYSQREDGLMTIEVPQGAVNLDVRWTTTEDVIAGRWMSGAALLLLCAVGWFERRHSRR